MTLTASAPAVQVLVVDDSLPFREAMRMVIDATDGFDWIGDASCGEMAVEQAARLRPDLVLMDIRMPGIGGIEAARMIASRSLPTIVVLVTGAELPDAVSDGPAAEILPKDRVNPTSLVRIWDQYGANRERAVEALVETGGDSQPRPA
jgi:DNA-binding NarL/FixJ family response regulator